MTTLKHKAILLLFLLSSAHTAHSASSFGQAAQFLRKSLYWALSLSHPISLVHELHIKRKDLTEGPTCWEKILETDDLKKHHYLKYQAPIIMAKVFAHQELTKLGLPNSHVHPWHISCAGTKNVLIEHPLWTQLENALTTQNKPISETSEEELQEAQDVIRKFRGVLHHEAQHVLNDDIKYRFIAASAVGAMLPITARLAGQLCLKSTSLVVKTLNKKTIIQGGLNSVVGKQCFNKASRTIEQQADDGVTDPDAMHGLIDYFKEHDKANQALKEQAGAIKLLNFLENYATHPSPSSRIQKLEKRLQEIN